MKTKEEIRLLKRLASLKGRVRFNHIPQGIDGRQTTYATLLIEKKYYVAYACRSKKDKYDKKIGRVIAFGRAFKMFESKTTIDPSKIKRFKNDEL